MRFLLLLIVILLAPVPLASAGALQVAAFDPPRKDLVGGSPRVGSKQAAGIVKQRYRGSKILSINLIESKGPPVYRVKTLSAEGVVRYVFVDGRSGDVFE